MSASRIRTLWWEDRPDLGTGGVFAQLPTPVMAAAPAPPAISPLDVEIRTHNGGGNCLVHMTVTHRTTGVWVTGFGPSQIKLRDALMAELAGKVAERKAGTTTHGS